MKKCRLDKYKLDQNQTPLFNATKDHINREVIPFYVPGHKHGIGLNELREYAGNKMLQMDLNCGKDIDFLSNPQGVIREAQELAAETFGAREAFFLTNGTTSGIQAMIMSVCNPGEKILVPRNAHRSVVSALIFSGAIPVYIQPQINYELGISVGVNIDEIERIINTQDIKAVFVINPSYYGHVSDLKKIVEIAHKNGIITMTDEAHGSHMGFNENFPSSAMVCGADMSTMSIHKTAGAMTQASLLLFNSKLISSDKVFKVLNLLRSSSPSNLLLCSLDIARKQLALKGDILLQNALDLARWARDEINTIPGLYAFGKELIGENCYGFDETKLGICVKEIGLTGFELDVILREQYNIQIELADYNCIMCIISLGDTKLNLEALVNALRDISKKYRNKKNDIELCIPSIPRMMISPREAFYCDKEIINFNDSIGYISGETIMCYPPGVPVINCGELINKEIVNYILKLKNCKAELQGMSDSTFETIQIIKKDVQ